MIQRTAFSILLLCTILSLNAQVVQVIQEGKPTNLRGLSISGNELWVSGSNGHVAYSANGGATWNWVVVHDFQKTDFRDIEIVDRGCAVIMGIASPAYILKTTNYGQNWEKVYENRRPDMFLDAMAFSNQKRGLVIGDPIDGKIFIAETRDGGKSWKETQRFKLHRPLPGEAFFAASGTNLYLKGRKMYLVSGGSISRLFMKNKTQPLPLMRGKISTGANSIAVYKNKIAVAGGDFADPGRDDSVMMLSNNTGKKRLLPQRPPGGYRSCVCFINATTLAACGLNGVDFSEDGGKTWRSISREAFNVCAYDKKSNTLFLAGNNGRLGKVAL